MCIAKCNAMYWTVFESAVLYIYVLHSGVQGNIFKNAVLYIFVCILEWPYSVQCPAIYCAELWILGQAKQTC